MKYIVAVSGGVDSVVLLDMLMKHGADIVVAHFDHGIRPNSADDGRFVKALARQYGVDFVSKREELGSQASEELARDRRYSFLRQVAAKYNAKIMTAHHLNDLIETIALNLTRGTGWRGLAVFGDSTIRRPLLQLTKEQLYGYALRHNLEWVEDETNRDPRYTRNHLRSQLVSLPSTAIEQLRALWEKQHQLLDEIENEKRHLLTPEVARSRYFFTLIDMTAALELLHGVLADNRLSLTRPQRLRLLQSIKTARAGTTYEAGGGVRVMFTPREFIVKDSR